MNTNNNKDAFDIIMTDIQDTLLDQDGYPLQPLLDTLSHYSQNGAYVCAATDAHQGDATLHTFVLSHFAKNKTLFTRIVSYSDVDCRKENDVYWERVVPLLDVPAERIIFLDNDQRNIDNALRHNIRAIHVTDDGTQACADLAATYNGPAL